MSLPAEERERWGRAGWLHDALRDLPDDELRALVPELDWDVKMLHGPAAANRGLTDADTDAGAHAWKDAEVLLAVRWHSVGCAEWGMTGKALYSADYLDPERPFDRDGRADLARRFPTDPESVFREIVKRRVEWTERSGWPLLEPTRHLWKSLH